MESIIKLENVRVNYGEVTALEEINLTVYENDFLGIIGPNGGGKSTLLKVLLGLIKPSKGKVRLFDTTPARARKKVGYVAQYRNFDPGFPINVWDVVLMGRLGHAGLLRGYSSEDKQAALDALKTVDMLDLKKRHISQLSGGQQQRILIARALTTKPGLLLLDEPMSNVDSVMQKEFYELLKELNKHMAIIMVSHDITAVSLYVNKVACLNKKLHYHGSRQLSAKDLETAYQCPVELIAHGVPHRIFKDHAP